MLDEYVVVPDVFDEGSYHEGGACGVSLRWLKDALLQDGLVRDLRDGGWSKYCAAGTAQFHHSTKEVLAKLRSNNRLRTFDPQLHSDPASAADWLAEGLASHAVEPVNGIIAAHTSAAKVTLPHVVSVEKLTGAPWWQSRSPSKSLIRSATSYAGALEPILKQSRSLMFIDPYLDPSAYNYRQLPTLLRPLQGRSNPPLLEFHRSLAYDGGHTREFLDEAQWRGKFGRLNQALGGFGVRAKIFIWQTFHDRFLISDVIGLNVSSGFDTTTNPNDTAVWSRLGRANKDDKQREFDPSVRPNALAHAFDIGSGT